MATSSGKSGPDRFQTSPETDDFNTAALKKLYAFMKTAGRGDEYKKLRDDIAREMVAFLAHEKKLRWSKDLQVFLRRNTDVAYLVSPINNGRDIPQEMVQAIKGLQDPFPVPDMTTEETKESEENLQAAISELRKKVLQDPSETERIMNQAVAGVKIHQEFNQANRERIHQILVKKNDQGRSYLDHMTEIVRDATAFALQQPDYLEFMDDTSEIFLDSTSDASREYAKEMARVPFQHETVDAMFTAIADDIVKITEKTYSAKPGTRLTGKPKGPAPE